MCRLHKAVSNPHLVKLYSYFEDSNFVYIVLELCRFLTLLYETLFYVCTRSNLLEQIKMVCCTRKRSLMELHKRRKAITEPESRYFVHQVGEMNPSCLFYSNIFTLGWLGFFGIFDICIYVS